MHFTCNLCMRQRQRTILCLPAYRFRTCASACVISVRNWFVCLLAVHFISSSHFGCRKVIILLKCMHTYQGRHIMSTRRSFNGKSYILRKKGRAKEKNRKGQSRKKWYFICFIYGRRWRRWAIRFDDTKSFLWFLWNKYRSQHDKCLRTMEVNKNNELWWGETENTKKKWCCRRCTKYEIHHHLLSHTKYQNGINSNEVIKRIWYTRSKKKHI